MVLYNHECVKHAQKQLFWCCCRITLAQQHWRCPPSRTPWQSDGPAQSCACRLLRPSRRLPVQHLHSFHQLDKNKLVLGGTFWNLECFMLSRLWIPMRICFIASLSEHLRKLPTCTSWAMATRNLSPGRLLHLQGSRLRRGHGRANGSESRWERHGSRLLRIGGKECRPSGFSSAELSSTEKWIKHDQTK